MSQIMTSNPTGVARVLLGKKNVFARTSINILDVFSCQELRPNDYIFLPMNDSFCYKEIPMKIRLNFRNYTAYLDPTTNIITHFPTPIDCSLDEETTVRLCSLNIFIQF